MWSELVTVGLLGTDRRDPPELPGGPLADIVDDTLRPTPQGRFVAAVAATVVARRCGALSLQPSASLMPPDVDGRSWLPVAAVERWRQIVAHWPVLEAEWLAVAAASGWQPAPDVLVALLRRHNRSPVVARAVVAWGGSTANWLLEHLPDLAPVDRPVPAPAEGRVLPVPAEIEPFLGEAAECVGALIEGLVSGTFKWSHRAVLLNAVARMTPAGLSTVIAALTRGRDTITAGDGDQDAVAPLAMWESLIELATARRDMLAELESEA